MDQAKARKLIEDTFQQSFDKKQFISCVAEMLHGYEGRKEPMPHPKDSFKKIIKSYERFGNYTDKDGRVIALLIVKLKSGRSIDDARVSQRNFVASFLKQRDAKDGALIAYVADDTRHWRFSFVKMEYKRKGEKITEHFTPSRRWSFLVGENERSHTAQSRFLPLMTNGSDPTFADIEQAFDIEVVSKEFFQQYRQLFLNTTDALNNLLVHNSALKQHFKEIGLDTVTFAKKLLGQILFLYFLQKKGWFGVERGAKWGEGSPEFLRNLFQKNQEDGTNFFDDILEPLFYDALRRDRGIDDHYYPKFECKIPFLNGGLFDPLRNYDWVDKEDRGVAIKLPNELFSNAKRTSAGDTGDGILDVLDRYNFTVAEDEPLERAVAIDPELLGKMHEKLNAITNENYAKYRQIARNKNKSEGEFNKANGVYYTPRNIVHYMCQQSIISYLTTNLENKTSDIPVQDIKDGLRQLIKTCEYSADYEIIAQERVVMNESDSTYRVKLPAFITEKIETIDQLLGQVTLCDPAVGSGAFPVGILQEIVKIREFIGRYIGREHNIYQLKRQCIERCIYGVDIDDGAVEVAKLRLWLSLIVDETDIDDIQPLPNLDYKIVCGNALRNIDLGLWQPSFAKLEAEKQHFLSITDSQKKESLRLAINQLIHSILKGRPEDHFCFRLYFSEIFRKDKQEQEGFDIIIANPPYVRLSKIKKDEKQSLQAIQGAYENSFDSTGDIYCLFYEQGIRSLKKNGHLCYITSNQWMRADYGKGLRGFLARQNPTTLLDFADITLFENVTVDTNILLVQKANNKLRTVGVKFNSANFTPENDIDDYVASQGVVLEHLSDKTWRMLDKREMAPLKKMEKMGVPIQELDVKIHRGVVTGRNDAFVINTKTKEMLIEQDSNNSKIIRPLLKGKDIKRYYAAWNDNWLITAFPSLRIDINDYPSIKEHFLKFTKVDQSGKPDKLAKSSKSKWFETDHNIVYHHVFEQEKIIYPDITASLPFMYDTMKYYTHDTCFIITGGDLKYLCGILNSRAVRKWIVETCPTLGPAVRVKIFCFHNTPIPRITDANRPLAKQVEQLVEQISKIKQTTPSADTSVQESKIDALAYKLYGLTKTEIALVESRDTERPR